MWHMKPNTSSTSTWARWPFFCSNLVKSMDSATNPVIHAKTRTAAYIPNIRDCLAKGTPQSLNPHCVLCRAFCVLVVVIKQLANNSLHLYLFHTCLPHVFFSVHSFKRINIGDAFIWVWLVCSSKQWRCIWAGYPGDLVGLVRPWSKLLWDVIDELWVFVIQTHPTSVGAWWSFHMVEQLS